jgi:MFS transporter, DHA2 family, multidrug resistance protein
VGLTIAGLFLVFCAFIRRLAYANPFANLGFLKSRNIAILASSIFVFRFVMLTPVVLIPAFLGNIQRYRALQTGHALAWVAAPQFLIVWLIAVVVVYTNSRLILGVGLTIVAVSCWVCARVDPSWAGTSFEHTELALAIGLGCAYIGMVGSIVLEALEAGALKSPANVATFSGLMHFVRIFGGGVGVAILNHFLTVRRSFIPIRWACMFKRTDG